MSGFTRNLKLHSTVFGLSTLVSHAAFAASQEFTFTDFRSSNGYLAVSVFSEKDASAFPGDVAGATKTVYQPLNGKTTLTITIEDLPPGTYAISALHDENGDHRLQTALGIPREGFGFSNNPTIFFGPPSFKTTAVQINDKPIAPIKMKYLL
jgi:uncharacterized protein (DUF2141 family)